MAVYTYQRAPEGLDHRDVKRAPSTLVRAPCLDEGPYPFGMMKIRIG